MGVYDHLQEPLIAQRRVEIHVGKTGLVIGWWVPNERM
jgi:hypothetical protein